MAKHKTNVGDVFQVGEVWETPRGALHRVMAYDYAKQGKPRVILRVGESGSGRKSVRDWDAVEGWVIYMHVDGRLAAAAPPEGKEKP